MEYLYFKKKVAQMRKDLLRPENTLDNGRFTFLKDYSLSENDVRRALLCLF